MTDGITVEQFFFTGTNVPDYVLIRAYVGKLPPTRVKTYIENLRTNLKLCKTLDELEIGFDILGVRDDGSRVKPNAEKITEDHDSGLTMKDIGEMAAEKTKKELEGFSKAVKILMKQKEAEQKTDGFDEAMKIVAD